MPIVSNTFLNAHRVVLVIFSGLALLIFILFISVVKRGIHIDTDLQSLLPRVEKNDLVQLASKRIFKKVGNRIILLIGSADQEKALQAARMVDRHLLQSASLQRSPSRVEHKQQLMMLDLYKKHHDHLLTQEYRAQLMAGNEDNILKNALRLIYGPASWSRVSAPAEDPLGLTDTYLSSLNAANKIHMVKDSFVVLDSRMEDGLFYVLLTAKLKDGVLDMTAQQAVNKTIQSISEQLTSQYPTVSMLKSGVAFHAAEAAKKAKNEVSTIAVGSSIGIIILFLLAFGTPMPLFLSLCSIAFGFFCAFTICSSIFSKIHIFTLVFGATLIGVVIDYSLHYFVRLSGDQLANSRLLSLRILLPSMLLGLITTILGYGFLMQAALPGLTQISVFSVSGVIASWLFVVCICPYVARVRRTNYPEYLVNISLLSAQFWALLGRKKSSATLLLMISFSIVVDLSLVKVADDIRMLYVPSPELIKQERKVQRVLHKLSPNQFYLVTGSSAQQLLMAEERFQPHLESLVAHGAIESYDIISRYLPSIQRQKENYDLLKSGLYGEAGVAKHFMTKVGFSSATVNGVQQRFHDRKDNYLQPADWLEAAHGKQSILWLGRIGAVYASVITLYGVSDTSMLVNSAAEDTDVIFVDKVKDLSDILGEQRHKAGFMLAVAYFVVMLLLLFYYRKLQVVALVAIPILSTLFTLALLSLAGVAITIFHVFAMFLILGLGMDYSIFIYESSADNKVCLLAIFLSAVTSCLSFGLLSFSSTPMLSAFGVTVLLGSLLNLLLVPLIVMIPRHVM